MLDNYQINLIYLLSVTWILASTLTSLKVESLNFIMLSKRLFSKSIVPFFLLITVNFVLSYQFLVSCVHLFILVLLTGSCHFHARKGFSKYIDLP